jgi:hypothetical protein
MNYNRKITIPISMVQYLIEAKSIRERTFRMKEMLRNLEEEE